MSAGIIPDAVNGGIVVTTLPAPAGVNNAYVPPGSFTISSALHFYGGNCSATRFDPQQFNALESEMLCLAATLAPNGTWNTGSVCNLAAAFQTWAQSITAGSLSLAPSADYPSLAASNTTAATPAYVGAAISAAVGSGLSKAVAADYPTDVANDVMVTTPAYVAAAIAGGRARAADYPSASDGLEATPGFVTAGLNAVAALAVTEIATAVSTVEALIPALTTHTGYPSSSDTTAATPHYVGSAIAAIGAGLSLTPAASYPSASDTTAASPAYVGAAISGIGAGLSLTHAAAYPSASDSTAASPAYVADAVAAVAGSGGTPLYNISAGVPALSSFTAFNISTVTVVESAGKAVNLSAASSVTGIFGYKKAVPSTPYRVRVLMQNLSLAAPGNLFMLAGWTDGTKFEHVELRDNQSVHVEQYANTTSENTHDFISSFSFSPDLMWFGLRDDGTNVYWELSRDGVNFITLYSIAKASGYLSAYSNVFFGGFAQGAAPWQITMRCWDVAGLTPTFP